VGQARKKINVSFGHMRRGDNMLANPLANIRIKQKMELHMMEICRAGWSR